ncbi:hypothetical protein JTB14_027979 [Gonioctena quinquepunctata]|nr:hypothetical protein JTB14_027979 [Gonioctena quinquepunctata]
MDTMVRRYKKNIGITFMNNTEENSVKALDDIDKGKKTSRQAAEYYGVPKSTLHDEMKGRRIPITGIYFLSKCLEKCYELIIKLSKRTHFRNAVIDPEAHVQPHLSSHSRNICQENRENGFRCRKDDPQGQEEEAIEGRIRSNQKQEQGEYTDVEPDTNDTEEAGVEQLQSIPSTSACNCITEASDIVVVFSSAIVETLNVDSNRYSAEPKKVTPRLKQARYGEVSTTAEVVERLKGAERQKKEKTTRKNRPRLKNNSNEKKKKENARKIVKVKKKTKLFPMMKTLIEGSIRMNGQKEL